MRLCTGRSIKHKFGAKCKFLVGIKPDIIYGALSNQKVVVTGVASAPGKPIMRIDGASENSADRQC